MFKLPLVIMALVAGGTLNCGRETVREGEVAVLVWTQACSISYFSINNTQIAAVALPPSTTHPQLWAELLTFKPKCTIA